MSFITRPALLLPFLLLAASAHGQVASPDPQRQSLGSLNSSGEVFVNGTRAPSELTIFPGDAVRTGETGTAILTTSGNNSFQISRQSQVVFAGDPHYFAELESGGISVKSLEGTSGAVVRAGNFAVVPTNRNERTTATIEKLTDGWGRLCGLKFLRSPRQIEMSGRPPQSRNWRTVRSWSRVRRATWG